MAKTAAQRARKRPPTVEEPAAPVLDTAEQSEPPAESGDEPAPADPAEPDARPTRRTAKGQRDPMPKVLTFFEQIARIPKADWGPRATIRIYRKEPIIDRLRGSDTKYIMVYEEPVTEEKIKVDHGSGRYKLFLNYKMPGAREGKEVDSVEFDILDRNFPPRIAPGEWVEDSRNRKWAWAKEFIDKQNGTAPAAPPPVSIVHQVKEVMDVANMLRPEPAPPQRSIGSELKDIVGTLDTLGLGPHKDSADTPIMRMLLSQMDSMRAEITAAQARNDSLMLKLIEIKTAPPPPPPPQPNGISVIKEIVTTLKDDLLPIVKDFLPEPGETGGRRGKWWEDVAVEIARQAGPAIPMLAQGIMQYAQSNRQQPPPRPPVTIPTAALPSGQQPNPQPPQSGPDLDGMLLNALANESNGADFAAAIFTLYGPLTYKQISMMGEQGILTMLQSRPVWNQLGGFQAQMPQFVADFVAYGKEEEEEDTPTPAEETAPVDLTAEVAS